MISLQEFTNAMSKLINRFGVKYYNSDVLILIYQEIKVLDSKQVHNLINELLGSAHRAPLVPDFRNAVSKTREITWVEEKKKNTRISKNFLKQEDFTRGFKLISEMLNKNDFTQSRKLERFCETAHMSDCKMCNGEGKLIAYDKRNIEYRFKCSCEIGSELKQDWPVYEKSMINFYTLKPYNKTKLEVVK